MEEAPCSDCPMEAKRPISVWQVRRSGICKPLSFRTFRLHRRKMLRYLCGAERIRKASQATHVRAPSFVRRFIREAIAPPFVFIFCRDGSARSFVRGIRDPCHSYAYGLFCPRNFFELCLSMKRGFHARYSRRVYVCRGELGGRWVHIVLPRPHCSLAHYLSSRKRGRGRCRQCVTINFSPLPKGGGTFLRERSACASPFRGTAPPMAGHKNR